MERASWTGLGGADGPPMLTDGTLLHTLTPAPNR